VPHLGLHFVRLLSFIVPFFMCSLMGAFRNSGNLFGRVYGTRYEVLERTLM